jgi:hypothetical protein
MFKFKKWDLRQQWHQGFSSDVVSPTMDLNGFN